MSSSIIQTESRCAQKVVHPYEDERMGRGWGVSVHRAVPAHHSRGLCVPREPERQPVMLCCCPVFPLHASPAKSFISCKSMLRTQISITHKILLRERKVIADVDCVKELRFMV